VTVAGLKGLCSFPSTETIGRGHFGIVRLAEHALTREKVAVKIIEKANLDAETRDQLYKEVKFMKLLKHPHIISLYEVSNHHEYACSGRKVNLQFLSCWWNILQGTSDVRLLLVCNVNRASPSQVCETPSQLYLILELADGGDLFERVTSCGRLSEDVCGYMLLRYWWLFLRD
jgi:serine/threonine protein kinase